MNRVAILLKQEETTGYLPSTDVEDVLDDLSIYGPRVVGVVVRVDPRFRVDLPAGWEIERLESSGGIS